MTVHPRRAPNPLLSEGLIQAVGLALSIALCAAVLSRDGGTILFPTPAKEGPTMNTPVPDDRPPVAHELGGIEPAIHSPAELESAVETIAYIQSRRRMVLSTFEQKLRFLEEERDESLTIDVAGQSVTFDDREAAIRQCVADYVCAHRLDVFPPGSQTVHFARGAVSLSKCKPRIDYADGSTKSLVAGRIIKRHQLIEKLTQCARRLKIAPYLRLKAELDVAGIKKAFETGILTRKDLTNNLLRYVDDEEQVLVKTHDHKGRSYTPDPAS